MPAKKELTMRQVRHMLRLTRDGVSAQDSGRSRRRAQPDLFPPAGSTPVAAAVARRSPAA
jgi:hypothetical protein